MLPRPLPPLHLDEFTAQLLKLAVEREVRRIAEVAAAARDRADRQAWAFAKVQSWDLADVRNWLDFELRKLGPLSPDARQHLADRVQRRTHKMPRSAANAHLLKAEKEARRAAAEAASAQA